MKFTNKEIVETLNKNYRKAAEIYRAAVEEDFSERKARATQFDPMPVMNGKIQLNEIREAAGNKIAALRDETIDFLGRVYEDVKADQMEDPTPEAMRALEALALAGQYATESLFNAVRERYGENFTVSETLNAIGEQMHERNPEFKAYTDDLGYNAFFDALANVQHDIEWHMTATHFENNSDAITPAALAMKETSLRATFPYKDSGAAEGETATGAEA